ncbi:MAG: MBL fold metallo-hydrolase [Flavisolibacter sp.]
MSLYVSSLNSGSNGNCYYIGNENEAVLVDAGISCREIEKRMKRLHLPMQKVKAVFISHEHSDHIKGLSFLSKKYNLPVYITDATRRNGYLFIEKQLLRSFQPHQPVQVGELSVLPFPKLHDAADPYSFTIKYKEVQIGVFTDIGRPCQNVIHQFSQCHAAFLEANYDDEMLDKGNYPFYLKKRIKSETGHLSNLQALELFQQYRPGFMSHLFLSHLSKNNNSPELVETLFNMNSQGVKIVVASRYAETPVYYINNSLAPRSIQPDISASSNQLQLCFS